MEICEGRSGWQSLFAAQIAFNSYPMNNGDNVWEPGLRVGTKGAKYWKTWFMVGEIGENFGNRVLGQGNGRNAP